MNRQEQKHEYCTPTSGVTTHLWFLKDTLEQGRQALRPYFTLTVLLGIGPFPQSRIPPEGRVTPVVSKPFLAHRASSHAYQHLIGFSLIPSANQDNAKMNSGNQKTEAEGRVEWGWIGLLKSPIRELGQGILFSSSFSMTFFNSQVTLYNPQFKLRFNHLTRYGQIPQMLSLARLWQFDTVFSLLHFRSSRALPFKWSVLRLIKINKPGIEQS